MITPEHEYYIRFILLLLQGGTDLLRAIFNKALQQKNETLYQFLASIRPAIQTSGHLTKIQEETLYPTTPQGAFVEDFDITLLSYLIINHLVAYIDFQESNAVNKIRDLRNNFHAHAKNAMMDTLTFTKEWNNLVKIIMTVGFGLSSEVQNKHADIIQSIEKDPLDVSSAVQEIQKLDQSRVFFERIQKSLEDIHKTQERLAKSVEDMQTTTENTAVAVAVVHMDVQKFARDTIDEMMEIKAKLVQIIAQRENQGRITKVVHTIYGKVFLSGDDQETVDQAEKTLLEASNNSIAKKEPTEPNHKVVKDKVTIALKSIESEDVEVQGASKGSVIFEIRCMSLTAIVNLIDRFYSCSFRNTLDDITEALEYVIGKKIYIATVEIDKQSVQDVITQILSPLDIIENVVPPREDSTKNLTDFLKDFAETGKQAFETNGLDGVCKWVIGNLYTWNTMPLNAAVIGSVGVGKSSFINTLFHWKRDDQGAAKVDEVDRTIEPTVYSRGDVPKLKLWDLPGLGARFFPREHYLEQIKFERYDLFIIITATRLTEDDIWLAKTIHGTGKDFFIVRTKIDLEVASLQTGDCQPVNVEENLKKIKSDCKNQIQEAGLPSHDVYFIENYASEKYEFNTLCTRMFQDATDSKRKAMVMVFSAFAEGVVRARAEVLKSRIKKLAFVSGVGSAIPLPGLGIAVDGGIVLKEALHYRQIFNLTDEGLAGVAYTLRVTLNDLKDTLDLKSSQIVYTTEGIVTFCQVVLVSGVVGNISKFAIPIFGSFVAGAASFWNTCKCLEKLLNLIVEDAFKVNQKLGEVLERSII